MEKQRQSDSSIIETKNLQRDRGKTERTESTGEYQLRHMEKCREKDQVVDGDNFIFKG